MTPEFPRPYRIDTIGDRPRRIEVEASEEERAALARRFGLLAVDRLAADFTVRREAAAIVAQGRISAVASQACVVTGEPVPADIDETVALRFLEEEPSHDEEIELSGDALDVMPIDGGTIDLGEAAAETMALALDPFPRAPDAEKALRDAGVVREEEAGPFGALAGLKARLEGKPD